MKLNASTRLEAAKSFSQCAAAAKAIWSLLKPVIKPYKFSYDDDGETLGVYWFRKDIASDRSNFIIGRHTRLKLIEDIKKALQQKGFKLRRNEELKTDIEKQVDGVIVAVAFSLRNEGELNVYVKCKSE